MSNAKRITVAEYLTQQINICGKSQKDIAEEVGYEMPNVITMFKQGKTKLPINKVPLFAKALGVDPVHLLRVVMSEYMPDTWDVLEKLLGGVLVSEHEATVLDIIRTVAEGQSCGPETEADANELAELALKWKVRADNAADASRRRIEDEKKKRSGAR